MEAVVAPRHRCVTVTRRLWVRPQSKISYYLLIFSFSLLVPTQKLGDEFRHSTRNVSKNSSASGKRCVFTLGSLCLLFCDIQREADLLIFNFIPNNTVKNGHIVNQKSFYNFQGDATKCCSYITYTQSKEVNNNEIFTQSRM